MLEADMKYSSNDIKAGKDSFCSFHPAALLLYFILTIGIPMFVMHPVILMISFISALIYAVYQNGNGGIRRGCLYLFPAALFVVLVNALFQHRGVTVLYYFPSGNPLTLESIAYGFASAGMMVAVMLWFFICSRVMTSDKFVYLFGRVMPVLSLLLSMVLRLIPLFYKQFQNVQEAQRSMGRDFSEGTLIKRMKCAVTIFSIMFTWAMENAIITADSMKSRGYGLSGRTAFSLYRFEKRDRKLLGWLLFCGFYMAISIFIGWLDWSYYPQFNGALLSPFSVGSYICYLALCTTPVIIGKREERIWEICKSEI